MMAAVMLAGGERTPPAYATTFNGKYYSFAYEKRDIFISTNTTTARSILLPSIGGDNYAGRGFRVGVSMVASGYKPNEVYIFFHQGYGQIATKGDEGQTRLMIDVGTYRNGNFYNVNHVSLSESGVAAITCSMYGRLNNNLPLWLVSGVKRQGYTSGANISFHMHLYYE